MEIIIKGEPEEIADLVLAVQGRQEDSLENDGALEGYLFSDSGLEIVQTREKGKAKLREILKEQ